VRKYVVRLLCRRALTRGLSPHTDDAVELRQAGCGGGTREGAKEDTNLSSSVKERREFLDTIAPRCSGRMDLSQATSSVVEGQRLVQGSTVGDF
jgi:hypothetical protein